MFQNFQNKTPKFVSVVEKEEEGEDMADRVKKRAKREASLNNKSWQELIPKTKTLKCISAVERKEDEGKCEEEDLADRIKKSTRGVRAKREASLNNKSWQELIPKPRKSGKESGEKGGSVMKNKKDINGNDEAKKCGVIILKLNWTHYLKRNRVEVRLKNMKIPHDSLTRKVTINPLFNNASVLNKIDKDSQTPLQNKNNSHDIKTVSQLKLNPKTIKERQNNEDILSQFNEGHSDDLFDSEKIPRFVSQLNLLDSSFSSSDQESVSENDAKTPITKHLPHFEGWSAQTPEHLRVEQEEKENKENTPGPKQFSQLAFLHKTVARRNRQKNLLTKNGQSTSKNPANVFSSAGGSNLNKKRLFGDYLSELEPAVEHLNTGVLDESIDDQTEPWFDQDE